LGGAHEDSAVVAGDEVILPVLDDPAEERTVGAEQYDLALQGGSRCFDSDSSEERGRPWARGHDGAAAGDRLLGRANRRHAVAEGLQADGGLAGSHDGTAGCRGCHERAQMSRVTNL